MAVNMLVGTTLFDAGSSDDLRLAEELDSGPVTARKERVREVRAQTSRA